MEVTLGGHTFEIEINLNQRLDQDLSVMVDGQTLTVGVPDLDAPIDQMEWIIVDRRPHAIVIDPELRWLRDQTGVHFVEVRLIITLWPPLLMGMYAASKARDAEGADEERGETHV